jgi:hypothetical protein
MMVSFSQVTWHHIPESHTLSMSVLTICQHVCNVVASIVTWGNSHLLLFPAICWQTLKFHASCFSLTSIIFSLQRKTPHFILFFVLHLSVFMCQSSKWASFTKINWNGLWVKSRKYHYENPKRNFSADHHFGDWHVCFLSEMFWTEAFTQGLGMLTAVLFH